MTQGYKLAASCHAFQVKETLSMKDKKFVFRYANCRNGKTGNGLLTFWQNSKVC